MKYTLLALGFFTAAVLGNLAVPSVHNDCGATCTYSNGCCGSDSTCSGNAISKRCCPNNSGFCGCISSRGFCNGYVYNSPNVNGSDNFGACFNTTEGFCTLDSSSNQWIVCPIGSTACPSNSGYTCCTGAQQCYTNSGASFAVCAVPTNSTNAAKITTPQQGQLLVVNQPYTFSYTSVVNPSSNSYDVIAAQGGVVGANQAYGQASRVNPTEFTYTPRAYSAGFYNLSFIEPGAGQYAGQNYATTVIVDFVTSLPSTTSTSTPSTTSQNSGDNSDPNSTCLPNGCAGGAKCCAGQCYSTGQYTCYTRTDGTKQLCPSGFELCGSACYQTSSYSCKNGQLASN